jgi:hypothetical protein
VTIATDNSGTWQGEALLGTDDMDNSLALVSKAEICDAKVLDIVLEGHALESRVLFLDEGFDVLEVFPRGGGNVLWILLVFSMFNYGIVTYVICSCKCAIRPSDLSSGILQSLEGLLMPQLVGGDTRPQ